MNELNGTELIIEVGTSIHGGFFWRITSAEEGVSFETPHRLDGLWTTEVSGSEKTAAKAIKAAAEYYARLVAASTERVLVARFADAQVAVKLAVGL